MFVLDGVSVSGREPRAAILKVEACFGLVDGLEQLSSLPKLRRLDVCDTALAQAAFVERRLRALDAEVRTDGGALVVGGCRVGRDNEEVTPLWCTADDGQVQVARGLLAGRGGRGGVEVDRARADGLGTPLHQASFQGFVDVAKLLLDHRADANRTNAKRQTPLLWASYKGHVDVVRLLLRHNADATVEDKRCDDALASARQLGHREVVNVLVEAQRRQE